MAGYLLDSNTLIFFLKGHPQVVSRWQRTPPNQMQVPAVVWFEVMAGATLSARPEVRLGHLARLREVLRILPLGEVEAVVAAQIRGELARTGQRIGPLDTQTAGIARSHGLTMVTNNLREFTRVQDLHVVDWTAPG